MPKPFPVFPHLLQTLVQCWEQWGHLPFLLSVALFRDMFRALFLGSRLPPSSMPKLPPGSDSRRKSWKRGDKCLREPFQKVAFSPSHHL